MKRKKDNKINDIEKIQFACRYPDGTIKNVTYSEVKNHNISIIEDNACFGLMHPGDYTKKEVNKYFSHATTEQKKRMKALRENTAAVLVWNQAHQMYELEEEQKDD